MRSASGPNYEECRNRVIEFVKKPEVAGFYIGMTGPDLRVRLHGYHHYYAGRRQGWTIAEGLDEKGALDLEEYLCGAARDRKYRATALFSKYDEKDATRHFRNPGWPQNSVAARQSPSSLFGMAPQVPAALMAGAGQPSIPPNDQDTG